MNFYAGKTATALFLTAILFISPAGALTQKEFAELCIKGSALDVATALKDEGITANKPDGQGVTPLMAAAQARGEAADPNKIALLLKAGNNVNATANNSANALMYAAQSTTNPDVIIKLIQSGAQVNAENDKSWTPLSFAAARNPETGVIEALIDCGANIDAKDRTGSTPLVLAVRGGNEYAVIDTLLRAGADPTIADSNKRTAASYLKANKKLTPEQADELELRMKEKSELQPMTPERFVLLCRRGSGKQIARLLEARTDPDALVQGMTPLMWAARDNPRTDAVSALLQWGAEENAKTEDGRTALIFAAKESENPKVLPILLAYGARADYQDISGKNAWDYASVNPAFFPEDTLLLKAILESVKEAEQRGVKLEKERQNVSGAVTELFPMTELYQKMAADQDKILKLNSQLAELQNKIGEERIARRSAQKAESDVKAELERQNQLIQDLSKNITELRADKERDLAQSREVTEKFTALWQYELQRNLKLTKEMGVQQGKQKKAEEDLLQKIRTAEAYSQKLTEERRKDGEEHKQKIAALDALAAMEKQKLEDQLQSSIMELKNNLKIIQDTNKTLEQELLIARNRHSQELLDVKSTYARLQGEQNLKHSQDLAQLRERYELEKAEALSLAERECAEEAQKTADQLQASQKAELSRIEAQYKIDLLAQQDRQKELYSIALAEMEHSKNEELNRKLAEEAQEMSVLRAKNEDLVNTMSAALRREQSSYAELLKEKEALQAQAKKDIDDLKAEQSAAAQKALAEFNEKLAEREEQLQSDFAIQTAQNEATHRQEMLKSIADLEAKHSEAIARLKNENTTGLAETAAKLKAARTEALAQAQKIYDSNLAAALASMESAKNDNLSKASAIYREESRRTRDLLEAAYSQSIEQAEIQYNRRLEGQLAQQKAEYNAALEVIRSKNRQALEESAALASVEKNGALVQLGMKHQKELEDVRLKAEAGWDEREKLLIQRHQKELDELNARNQQAHEKLTAQLKQEYDEKIKGIIAQKDALAEEAILKLEAHQKIAMQEAIGRMQAVNTDALARLERIHKRELNETIAKYEASLKELRERQPLASASK